MRTVGNKILDTCITCKFLERKTTACTGFNNDRDERSKSIIFFAYTPDTIQPGILGTYCARWRPREGGDA